MTSTPPSSPDSISQIDAAAPVWSAREIEIDAPVEVVWKLLTQVSDWPSWNPDVKSVEVNGPVGEGMTFRWKAGPSTISSTIRYLDRLRGIAWTGKTMGIDAIHVWRLEPRGEGTFVRTEESYGGFVAHLLRRYLQGVLDNALTDGLRHLKAESERRVPPRSRTTSKTSSRTPRTRLPHDPGHTSPSEDPAGGAPSPVTRPGG
jgi:carbon monoxide dehydrogenase subunit G